MWAGKIKTESRLRWSRLIPSRAHWSCVCGIGLCDIYARRNMLWKQTCTLWVQNVTIREKIWDPLQLWGQHGVSWVDLESPTPHWLWVSLIICCLCILKCRVEEVFRGGADLAPSDLAKPESEQNFGYLSICGSSYIWDDMTQSRTI